MKNIKINEVGHSISEALDNNKKNILFKRLYIQFDEIDGDIVTGKEDHIWIFGAEEFKDKDVKVRVCKKCGAKLK